MTTIQERLRTMFKPNELASHCRFVPHEAADTIDKLVEVLTDIASFDDAGANKHLEATGSYGYFDEPGAVQLARYALKTAGVVKLEPTS